ncbi:MAG: fucose isomerase [Spirochaetaceae bacterium]|nr:MAG: fucose isomerase [Spirochaetaceae bacterium]
MRTIHKKITFGVIVGTRGFFNADHARIARTEIIGKLEALGYGVVILPVDATGHGAIETLDDATKCATLFRQHSEEIDGIVVILPNFGDEIGVVESISRAKLGVPVLVQACRDEIDKVDVKGRRDSFCGKISVCNNLVQYGIPFTDTESHTVDIASAEFTADLERFAKVCRVVKGLTSARIGAVGARPAPFQTVRFSEKLLQRHGITVVPVDLSVILGRATKLDENASSVRSKLEEFNAYGKIPSRIRNDGIVRQAKFSVVIEEWMDENKLDASCIQCWDSIQENYGCATCLTMSMMGEKLMPSACEVDLTGVLSMYALSLASGAPSGFLDWNNNYGSDPEKCVNVHCSNYPKSFMGNEIEISDLDVLGESLGRENCFGAVKGRVAAGDMTYFRVSTRDDLGMVTAYLGEGEFTDDPFPIDGGVAVCRVPGLRELLRFITKNGFEHHIAMVRGRWNGILREAIETYLDWELYVHE